MLLESYFGTEEDVILKEGSGVLICSYYFCILKGEMLATQFCPARVLSPFREESGDEELSVLPRHTKVVVTGNNRTKSVLVGLQGVVKKAVGLGGWHWLVLLLHFLIWHVLFSLLDYCANISVFA